MSLTEEEAALYDRQIRLWGIEAQARLKNAKVLVVGITPVASEIVKNLILAGINTLTMADDRTVSEKDIDLCFFFKKTDLGQQRTTSALSRCQALNGKVKINCYSSIAPPDLVEKYHDYDEVIITQDYHENFFTTWMSYVTAFTESLPNRPKIHCVLSTGMHAFGFADLGQYTYEIDEKPSKVSATPANMKTMSTDKEKGTEEKKIIQYPSLEEFEKASWSCHTPNSTLPRKMPKGLFLFQALLHLASPLKAETLFKVWIEVSQRLGVSENLLMLDDCESCCGESLVAINAIIGGIIAQETIQGLSHRGVPKGNWYFVDGRTCEATVLWIPTL